MKMCSMKVTKNEMKLREAMAQPSLVSGGIEEGPQYPYGLELQLNKDSLDKLGINVSDYQVGDSFTIEARVEVRSVSTSRGNYGNSQDMSLQITDMALED